MSKKGTSFKLDDRHFEILDTKSRELGVGKSEFLRNLIDSHHKVQLYASEGDLSKKTKNVRNLNYNEITISVLQALRREYDTTINKKKSLTTIKGFATKYDFEPSTVKSILKQLVRNKTMIIQKSEQGKEQFVWTYMGIVASAEYAPLSVDDNALISGSSIDTIIGMLGEYDEVVNYLSQVLSVDEFTANSTVRFFLSSYQWYFNWLREMAFPITGVNEELDLNYYRTQMIDYLLMLITNYGYSWDDWKTGKTLDLKVIFQKILEFKKREGNLA